MNKTLNTAETEAFGRELDELRDAVRSDLGQRDVDHLRRVIRASRYLEVGGRVLLHVGLDPITFAVGTFALGVSKILENMEIGHNVMHGQYDWTKDPALAARTYEWDNVCTGDDWRHSHNYEHHVFTNIVGRDRDVGYALLRVADEQRWHPGYVIQPISALVLATIFQWGVGIHDLRIDETLRGEQSFEALADRAKPFLKKAAWQVGKDYVFYPLIALHNAPRVAFGNLIANVMRNVWSFAVIFCGHFPEDVSMYPLAEVENQSRGAWYQRQMNGSANLEGGKLFHLLTGHLSHQIEHHLFPDIPAARYPEMAPKVREIGARYGQSYVTGTFGKQLASVAKRILGHALPPRPIAA